MLDKYLNDDDDEDILTNTNLGDNKGAIDILDVSTIEKKDMDFDE